MSGSLEKRVHGLSASDLYFIDREMRINGYNPFEQDDIVMYWYLGSKVYEQMLQASFRACDVEAQIRKIPTTSKAYVTLQYATKRRTWHDVYKAFNPIEKTDFSTLEFKPISDAELYARVSQRIRKQSR